MKHRWLGPWRASFDSCTNASQCTVVHGPLVDSSGLLAIHWVRSGEKGNRIVQGHG